MSYLSGRLNVNHSILQVLYGKKAKEERGNFYSFMETVESLYMPSASDSVARKKNKQMGKIKFQESSDVSKLGRVNL